MLHKSTEKRNAKVLILKIKLQINFPVKPLPAQHWMPELEYLPIYSPALGVLVQLLHYIPYRHYRSTGSLFQLLGGITIIQQRHWRDSNDIFGRFYRSADDAVTMEFGRHSASHC